MKSFQRPSFQNLATAALFLLLSACSNGGSAASTGGASPCSEVAIEGCLENQQSCVNDGSASHCEPCGNAQFADVDGSCKALEGTPLTHDFADFSTDPGQEILSLCQSWTINNKDEIWVHAVELNQNVSEHHSNWTFVPDDLYPGMDGVWPCDDRNYNQLSAALSGGVLYAQSTQAEHEVQYFANGAAIRIPPYSRIIGDVHVLNTTDHKVTGHAKLSIYSLPKEQVKVKLAPFHMTYEGLDIPAEATSRFYGSCDLDSAYMSAASIPFGMKIYYALPHTHKLASRFFFGIRGGQKDGQMLIDIAQYNGEPHGRSYNPEVDMPGANGLMFGCEYINNRPVNVKWGFGDQEMCEMLGFADSEVTFETRIKTADPDGSEGNIQKFTGACDTLSVKWTNDRPGGPGPM